MSSTAMATEANMAASRSNEKNMTKEKQGQPQVHHHNHQLRKALFTKEDVGNFHKLLGISCLVSFVYRLRYVGASDCNFGQGNATLLLFFICHHLMLNLSSFIFQLPLKRIVTGYRLWPEARLHALIFVCRSLACMLFFHYQDNIIRLSTDTAITATIDDEYMYYDWMVHLAIVLTSCGLADLVSMTQAQYSSRTIRDLDFPPMWKCFFSTIQFVATAICLLCHTERRRRRYTYHVLFIFVIQTNAFLMTLRRKNLASHDSLVSIYAGILLVGFGIIVWDDQYSKCVHSTATIGVVTAMIRFHLNNNNMVNNKYVLWTLVAVSVHAVPDSTILQSNSGWVVAHISSWVVAMTLGYFKTTSWTKEVAAGNAKRL